MTAILLVLLRTLACELGAGSGDAVEPVTAAEFDQAIVRIQHSRARDAESQEKLENESKDLLFRFDAPDQQALIHYSLCHAHAQSDVVRPDLIIEHGTRALTGLKDESLRMRTYVYVGDAQQVARRTDFPAGRTLAAQSYLAGLSELLHDHELPATAPAIPIGFFNNLPQNDPRFEEKERARQNAIAAQASAKVVADLVMHRDVLTHQIVDLYARSPNGTDELARLINDAELPAVLARDLNEKVSTAAARLPRGSNAVASSSQDGSARVGGWHALLIVNAVVFLALAATVLARWNNRRKGG